MPKRQDSNNIGAVIFDMDGLILDTETIAISTFIQACREHAFEPDISVFHKCIGVDSAATKKIMAEGYGTDFPLEAITGLWKKNILK